MIKVKDFFENVCCDGHYVLKEKVNGFWSPLGGGSPDIVSRRFPDYYIMCMYSVEGVIFLLVTKGN